MRGQALRYLWWQVVDRAGPRVLAGLFVSGGFLTMLWLAMRHDKPSPAVAENVLGQLHYQLVYMFLLLLLNGIVSQDRLLGFYRFYLAKPVNPAWFYGQHVALSFLGFVASSAAFITIGSLLIQPVWSWHHIGPGIAVFLLFGMLVFLCSTFVKHDWLLAGVLLVAVAVARGRWERDSGTLGAVLHKVLPPTHLLGWNRDLDAAQWLWIIGWGLGMFAAALAVLRLRAIAEE